MLDDVLGAILEDTLKNISIPFQSLLIGKDKGCIDFGQIFILYLLPLFSLLCQEFAFDYLEYLACEGCIDKSQANRDILVDLSVIRHLIR